MTIQEIDHLTEKFYQCVSFNAEHYPDFECLKDIFYGDGRIINNNFDKPVVFTVQSFAQTMMHQIEDGNSTFLAQQEIFDKTEIFGNMAQRMSVYEYSICQDAGKVWPRGINYIQYLFTEAKWHITSMTWSDEKADVKIPEEYLVSV